MMIFLHLSSLTLSVFLSSATLFPPPPYPTGPHGPSHPSTSPLRCGQIAESGITGDYPGSGNPPTRHSERRSRPLRRRERTPLRRNPRGAGGGHTPGKCHRRGIYFLGNGRRDKQPFNAAFFKSISPYKVNSSWIERLLARRPSPFT